MPIKFAPIMALVLKEWRAVVSALGAGATTLLMRKGGLAERSSGFSAPVRPFWLLPTDFHGDREKLLPAAHRFIDEDEGRDRESAGSDSGHRVIFRWWAILHAHAFVTDWDTVQQLAPYHLWTEEVVRERYKWADPPGIHALVLRVWRAPVDHPLPLGAATGGCTSWLELDLPAPPLEDSTPVLDHDTFATRRPLLHPGIHESYPLIR